jgi:hypothetical protein
MDPGTSEAGAGPARSREGALLALSLATIAAFVALLCVLLLLRTETVVNCVGEIRSRAPVTMRTKRDAWLISSDVRLGDVVRAGQPLMTLRYTDGTLETLAAETEGQVVDIGNEGNERSLLAAGSLLVRVAPPSSLYIAVALPAQFRGRVEVGGKAKYRIGLMGEPTISRVERFRIRQGDLGNVDYIAEVALKPADQQLTSLGRAFSVDLVAPGVRLIDYLTMR